MNISLSGNHRVRQLQSGIHILFIKTIRSKQTSIERWDAGPVAGPPCARFQRHMKDQSVTFPTSSLGAEKCSLSAR